MVGCGGDPTGAQRGDVARVALSHSLIELDVGEASSLFAQAVDAAGNALSTLPDVASTNAAIAAVSLQQEPAGPPPRRDFTVTAVGYGATQVIASVGSMTDTAMVVTFPASLDITGAGGTLASGSVAQLAVECFDMQGNRVTPLDGAESISWLSYDAGIAEVDDTGLVFAKRPGRAVIAARLPNGTADTITVHVVPGAFQGTASAAAGPSGTVVTYTVGAGQPDWDRGRRGQATRVRIANQWAFKMSGSDNSSLITAIPFGLEAGPTRVAFSRVGPDQLELETTFDISALATEDDLEPNNLLDGTPPTPVTLPFEDVLDDFFAFTLVDTSFISLYLNWDPALNADLDLWVADAAFTTLLCWPAVSRARPEKGTCRLPAGDYLLRVDNFDARSRGNRNVTTYHIVVETW
jgi:hypothetical protein